MLTAIVVVGIVSAVVYLIRSFGVGEKYPDHPSNLPEDENSEATNLPEMSQSSVGISILAAVGLSLISAFILIGVAGIPSQSTTSVCAFVALTTYWAMRKKRNL